MFTARTALSMYKPCHTGPTPPLARSFELRPRPTGTSSVAHGLCTGRAGPIPIDRPHLRAHTRLLGLCSSCAAPVCLSRLRPLRLLGRGAGPMRAPCAPHARSAPSRSQTPVSPGAARGRAQRVSASLHAPSAFAALTSARPCAFRHDPATRTGHTFAAAERVGAARREQSPARCWPAGMTVRVPLSASASACACACAYACASTRASASASAPIPLWLPRSARRPRVSHSVCPTGESRPPRRPAPVPGVPPLPAPSVCHHSRGDAHGGAPPTSILDPPSHGEQQPRQPSVWSDPPHEFILPSCRLSDGLQRPSPSSLRPRTCVIAHPSRTAPHSKSPSYRDKLSFASSVDLRIIPRCPCPTSSSLVKHAVISSSPPAATCRAFRNFSPIAIMPPAVATACPTEHGGASAVYPTPLLSTPGRSKYGASISLVPPSPFRSPSLESAQAQCSSTAANQSPLRILRSSSALHRPMFRSH